MFSGPADEFVWRSINLLTGSKNSTMTHQNIPVPGVTAFPLTVSEMGADLNPAV